MEAEWGYLYQFWEHIQNHKSYLLKILGWYSLWWSCSRWRRSRIFLTVNSNWIKSPWSDSFSCFSGSLWDIWYRIFSYGWSRRRHLNLCYWIKSLLPFYSNILQWFFFKLCAKFASDCFKKWRGINFSLSLMLFLVCN